jgi:hypothetical protein
LTIRIWEQEDIRDTPVPGMVTHKNSFGTLIVSPNGKFVASWSLRGRARIWKTEAGISEIYLPYSHCGPTPLAFSPDSETLASASKHGSVQIWNLGTQTVVCGSASIGDSPAGAVVFSQNGESLAVLWTRGTIQIGSSKTGELLQTLNFNPGMDDRTQLTFSPDGKEIALVWVSHAIWVWNIATGHPTMNVNRVEAPMWVAHNYPPAATNSLAREYAWLSNSELMLDSPFWPLLTGTAMDHLGDIIFNTFTVKTPYRFRDNQILRSTESTAHHKRKREIVLCHLPSWFRVKCHVFHHKNGIFGLETGEVVILELPEPTMVDIPGSAETTVVDIRESPKTTLVDIPEFTSSPQPVYKYYYIRRNAVLSSQESLESDRELEGLPEGDVELELKGSFISDILDRIFSKIAASHTR